MDRNLIETAFVSDGTRRPASPADLKEIASQGAEYQLLRGRSTDAIQDALCKLVANYNSLFLVLSLLDLDVPLSTRVVAAQAVEELLSSALECEFVSRRLLSIPLPLDVRSRRHEIVSPWAEFAQVKSFLGEVFESQHLLDEMWGSWRKTLDMLDADETQTRALEASLISGGFFADTVRSIRARDNLRLNSVFVERATDAETLSEMRNAQSLLTAFRAEVHSRFFATTQRAVQKPLKLKRGAAPARLERTVEADTAPDLAYGWGLTNERPHRYLGALEAKARVDKQISAIRDALFAGKNSTADRYLEDLLAFQLGQGDREHAAMSLCALTAIALDANQFEMADRLSEDAIKLTSDDIVAYTTRAEVFKQRGYFDAALRAYEEATLRFGPDRWARNGYADVLKEKGLFDDSAQRYRDTQKAFPDDPVAFNGEVGVLRAKGYHRAALALALKCAKKFEYDPVTRATLAGCLASLGKYEESLRQYRVAIELNWREVRIHKSYLYVLRDSGDLEGALRHADAMMRKLPDAYPILYVKATLLRAAGRLEEANSLYSGLMADYPTYIPARFGAAAVQILDGKGEEARKSLPETNMESETDWFGFRLRALSYAADGDCNRAAPRLSFGLGHCPWAKERSRFETALGLVELQRGELTQSITLLNRNLERLDARDYQIRLTFLAHAHAQRGATEVANVLVDRLFRSKEKSLRSTRNAIIAEYRLPVAIPETWDISRNQIEAKEISLAMAV
jgi:tetratricopeptide (TPR) repeat protein